MIPVRVAAVIVLVACWDAWRLLWGRVDQVETLVLILVAATVIGWQLAVCQWHRVGIAPVAAGLALYAVAALAAPVLVLIGIAAALLAMLAAVGTRVPRLPLAGVIVLVLPVLPTVDFLLAYPLRRVSATITVALLRMNGVAVALDGVALDWRGKLLLFDGPCSGVRMLWATLMLASIVALVRRYPPSRYARALLLAVGIAILGNALRAASLFYVENGMVPWLHGPVAHEAVGLLSFAMVAVAMLAATHVRWRRA